MVYCVPEVRICLSFVALLGGVYWQYPIQTSCWDHLPFYNIMPAPSPSLVCLSREFRRLVAYHFCWQCLLFLLARSGQRIFKVRFCKKKNTSTAKTRINTDIFHGKQQQKRGFYQFFPPFFWLLPRPRWTCRWRPRRTRPWWQGPGQGSGRKRHSQACFEKPKLGKFAGLVAIIVILLDR